MRPAAMPSSHSSRSTPARWSYRRIRATLRCSSTGVPRSRTCAASRRLGCVGPYGFFEALDYSRGNPELVRSWMSHHQGMSLLAAAEVLLGDRLKDAFHSEAQVRATERLLEERVPRTVVPDEAAPPRVLWPEESAA